MRNYPIKYHSKGAALLLLVSMMALIFTAFAIGNTSGIEYKALNDTKTAKALYDAKEAVLGWSVRQNTPGQLPCPEDVTLIDNPNEGTAQASCTLPAIGRLPWKTLGIGKILDGNNNQLWYVISTGFRDSPINTNTIAGLNVDGIPNSAVAIIFSPGIPLPTQNRSVPSFSNPPNVSDYLDLTNNNGDSIFVSTGNVDVFNDKAQSINKDELFNLVSKRILREIRGSSAQGLVRYYSSNLVYPFADINNDGSSDLQLNGTPTYEGPPLNLFFPTSIKSTLINNNWFPLINYQLSLIPQSVTLTLDSKTIVVTP